jgi:phosphoglycolate phosphatase-like HAD superfamily hydrolase
LLDNHALEDACFVRALCETFELSDVDTDWEHYRHASDDGIAAEVYERAFAMALPSKQRAVTVARFVQLLGAACAGRPLVPITGASTMLRHLARAGWGIALATGAWRAAAEVKLRSADLWRADRVLATSEDGPAKSAIIETAIARATLASGVARFDRIVTVGDGVWDVAAARALGLPFVGIGRGEREMRLRAAGAAVVFADFAAAADFLAACETAPSPRGSG